MLAPFRASEKATQSVMDCSNFLQCSSLESGSTIHRHFYGFLLGQKTDNKNDGGDHTNDGGLENQI